MSTKLPTEPIIVGEFEKNAKDTLRVTLHQFNGTDLISLRLFYKDKDGNLKPGKDGLSFKVEQFPFLARLLADAGITLKEHGLL
ncbi:MAG: transcriptional coactivator p15/PC4 family protein [Pirellula sp.]